MGCGVNYELNKTEIRQLCHIRHDRINPIKSKSKTSHTNSSLSFPSGSSNDWRSVARPGALATRDVVGVLIVHLPPHPNTLLIALIICCIRGGCSRATRSRQDILCRCGIRASRWHAFWSNLQNFPPSNAIVV
jgi:hypothetical protein